MIVACENNDNDAVNACENTLYQVSYGVRRYEAFWIKTQPYSLQYILNKNLELIKKLEGEKKIKKAEIIPGTYFSQSTDSSANYITSQLYRSYVATRAIVTVEVDNKEFETVLFIPIVMMDVLTVDLKPMKGKEWAKKEENIGTFCFGGSFYLFIFEPGMQLDFDLQGIMPDTNGDKFLNIRLRIATLGPAKAAS